MGESYSVYIFETNGKFYHVQDGFASEHDARVYAAGFERTQYPLGGPKFMCDVCIRLPKSTTAIA